MRSRLDLNVKTDQYPVPIGDARRPLLRGMGPIVSLTIGGAR